MGQGGDVRTMRAVRADAPKRLALQPRMPRGASVSTLFEVFNAITGTPEAPSTHNMPTNCRMLLLVLANRGERAWQSVETMALETGLGKSTVRAVLLDLSGHHWIRDTGERVGKGIYKAKVYEVHAYGDAWNEESKAKRARTVPPRSAKGSSSQQGQAPLLAGSAKGSTSEREGVQVVARRGPDGGGEPLSEPLQEPLKEPPNALACARVGLPLQQALLPVDPSPRADPAPMPALKVRKKAAKDPTAPKAWQLYAKAFVDGHADAGGTVIPPTEVEAKQLGRAASALAKYRGGTPITGEDLIAWIRERSRAFRDSGIDPDRHRGGWGAHGLVHWLNNDHAGRPWPTAAEREREAQLPRTEPGWLPRVERPGPPPSRARTRALLERAGVTQFPEGYGVEAPNG